MKTAKVKSARMIGVVVETPRGHRNQFKFRPQGQDFSFWGVRPLLKCLFPMTLVLSLAPRPPMATPLDVLLLMDEPAFPGLPGKRSDDRGH
jgi:inorganic pyrophosphatase